MWASGKFSPFSSFSSSIISIRRREQTKFYFRRSQSSSWLVQHVTKTRLGVVRKIGVICQYVLVSMGSVPRYIGSYIDRLSTNISTDYRPKCRATINWYVDRLSTDMWTEIIIIPGLLITLSRSHRLNCKGRSSARSDRTSCAAG